MDNYQFLEEQSLLLITVVEVEWIFYWMKKNRKYISCNFAMVFKCSWQPGVPSVNSFSKNTRNTSLSLARKIYIILVKCLWSSEATYFLPKLISYVFFYVKRSTNIKTSTDTPYCSTDSRVILPPPPYNSLGHTLHEHALFYAKYLTDWNNGIK